MIHAVFLFFIVTRATTAAGTAITIGTTDTFFAALFGLNNRKHSQAQYNQQCDC